MALAYRHSSRAALRHVLNLTLERYSHCARSLHTLGAEDDSLSRSFGQAGTSNSPFPCSATSTVRPLATKETSILRYDVEKRSTVTGTTDTPIHAESSRNPHRTETKVRPLWILVHSVTHHSSWTALLSSMQSCKLPRTTTEIFSAASRPTSLPSTRHTSHLYRLQNYAVSSATWYR